MTGRSLPDPKVEPTIKAARAAEILDVSVRSVHYAIDRGEIPTIRVGRSVRILTARFLAAYGLADQQQAPGDRPTLAIVRDPDAAA